MIRALFRLAGRFALLLATMAFLVGVSLFIVGSYILTWPILRLSPRDQKIAALTDVAAAGMKLMTVFSASQVKALAEEFADSVEEEVVDGPS